MYQPPLDIIVALLPYSLRHEMDLAEIKASSLSFPLEGNIPENINKISDLREKDHLIVYCCSSSLIRSHYKIRCRVSLMVAEPVAVQARYYFLLRFFWRKFFKVLTFSETLLKKIPNGLIYLPFMSWVSPISNSNKSKLVSIIASKKNQLPGQKLRHKLIKQCQASAINLDLFGRGYREIYKKEEALSDYMFSIAIENSQEANYVSEKLIDCFLQKVVPVYWGAPNIGDFFDITGIIYCQSLGDLINGINHMSAELYESMSPAIEKNYQLAKQINLPELSVALKLINLENTR